MWQRREGRQCRRQCTQMYSCACATASAICGAVAVPSLLWYRWAPGLRADCRVWAADVQGLEEGCGDVGFGAAYKYSEFACGRPVPMCCFAAPCARPRDFAVSA